MLQVFNFEMKIVEIFYSGMNFIDFASIYYTDKWDILKYYDDELFTNDHGAYQMNTLTMEDEMA